MHRKLRICDYRPLMDQLKGASPPGPPVLFPSQGDANYLTLSLLGCIKSIESLCSRFLWNGNITSKAAEKVSWNVVCLPRSEGGLGLRNLSIWNKTLSLKLVWLLHTRSPQAEQLHIILCSVQPPSLSSVRDCYNWYVDDLYLDSFNTARTWESVRDRSSTVDWESVVWFGGHVPRHAFHMWVTHLDSLPTISRIAAWDHNVENSCLLCNAPDENRDHLFLRCRFSERLWKMIIRRLGYQPFLFHTWTSLIEWLRMKDYTCPQTLHKLAAHAVIYHLWLERNNHLHNAVFSSTDRIFKNIDRHIRNTILARRGRKKFHSLMCTGLRFS
ncbi:uncharacterized protein LOC125595074 [Brassica napus]|uniref:uncharacterized protein LOC125595074 n=1 Tax=Brassica napus TaxID=3708 RepID=UPI0020790D10|nr:uncharacterized protein LOC125595074 [Brassica napus]